MAVNSILRAFAPAAKVTLPVGTGYLFLGAAYGIYMHVNGFSVWYPALMAWLIYGGRSNSSLPRCCSPPSLR